MKALLLNSGLGSRMGALTENRPKCMCQFDDDFTIISWQIELLKRNGIKDVIVTTGPFSDVLQEYILGLNTELNYVFVHNPMYRESNYIYSMYLAREHLNDDLLVFHGDLVMEPSVITDLIHHKQSVVAVDSFLPLPEKDFKARIDFGRVSAIGVEFFDDGCVACQPAYKLKYKDIQLWIEEISKFCKRGEIKVYAEHALNCVLDKIVLYPLELNKRLCNEIDNKNDLNYIKLKFQKLSRMWRK